jgi:release factor glutamine methyltransferase
MISDGLLRQGAALLADAGIADPLHEARLVARAVPEAAFLDKIAQRATRMPMSQVLGYRDFYKHRFIVTGDVLDPRPDTETLIEAALQVPFARVLDLGTGSGCILLSLLADRLDANGLGTDLSHAALGVARQNAVALDLADRACLIQSDWFSNVTGLFDLIVSNPPYIAAVEMADLQPEVRLFEPRCALTDDADGLSAYRSIAQTAGDYLTPHGHLMFEIGPTQGDAVSAMLRSAGFNGVQVIPDLDGRDRVVAGKKQ